ncbi:MAG: hypothetical protein GX131_13570 [candidate division WS1 bacterium]|nr:hypothetical protein [candidate division WS1 bacterium]
MVVSDSPRKTIYGFPGFYDPGAGPNQLQPGFTLGGTNNPVIAWVGQSMIFSPDNSRLWVGNELGGMSLYRNPLTNSGDRAPDLVLHIAGTQWYSIWYEAQSDTLYATTMNTDRIYAWDSASTGNANRAPDRIIEVPGYHGEGYLIGAHGSNTLLMAARVHNIERFVVFYDADQLDGLNAADRYFEPEGFNVAFTHALSWDATRNLLYYVVPDRNEISVYADASNLTGDVTPNRVINVPNVDGQDWITGAIVSSADDLLFVSTFEGQIMVFANASGLQGTPQPATTHAVGDMALGLGVFRQ